MDGGGHVIGVFAAEYIAQYPALGSEPVVLSYSPNATSKLLRYSALKYTHRIQPKFTSLNTPHLSWITWPFETADEALSACKALNLESLTDVEKAREIDNVTKWYVGGKEQVYVGGEEQVYWVKCEDCGHWRKTSELVGEEVSWRCPGTCPTDSDVDE